MKAKGSSLKVAVTGLGGGSLGEQILKALRLGKVECEVVGLDMNAQSPGLQMVDSKCLVPPAGSEDYVEAVLAICRDHGLQALFPGSEPELRVLSEHRHRFGEQGLFLPINPKEVIDLCLDKGRTATRLTELGFEPPRFEYVTSRKQLTSIDWFPVVVKPALGAGGSADCYIAQDASQLASLADYLGLETLARRFLVQEYVGTPDSEFTVGVLHDMRGRFINSIALQRTLNNAMTIRLKVPNQTRRTELGPHLVISSGQSQGYIGRFPEVTGPCESIAEALGVRGPVNVQCRLVKGQVKVFEINPRFSGTTSIRAMMGYNEPEVLLRTHVFGETVQPRFHYEEGLVLRGLVEYPIR